jgi:hypothetical protein
MKAKRLAAALFLLSVFSFGLGAHAERQRTSTEKKVVGTWESTGFDSRSRVVFRPDHVVVQLISTDGDDFNSRSWMPASWGEWRVDGNAIIVDNQRVFGLDGVRWTGQVGRLPIREFRETLLISDDGVSTWNRLSPGRERYGRLLSSFYILAGLAAIAVVIVAIRKAVVWRKVGLIGITAIGALTVSMLALLAELGGAGSLIISPHLLEWLRVPNDLVKVGLVMILVVATLKLTYGKSRRSRQLGVRLGLL